MAHFAKIDENNIVTQVIVVNNNVLDMSNEEESGFIFCQSLYGGNWKQTSYNAEVNGFRKNFAAIGCIYDEEKDAFIYPKPFPSWNLNQLTCKWEAPIPKPKDDKWYKWNESNQTWDEV